MIYAGARDKRKYMCGKTHKSLTINSVLFDILFRTYDVLEGVAIKRKPLEIILSPFQVTIISVSYFT